MSAKTDFWSNRKARVRAEAEAEREAILVAEQETDKKALEEQTDEEILSQLDLPDPDTLEHGDDFSAFMAKTVPDRIRRRALRKLWLSNPVLANVDGLVDYGEDYTDSATVVENLQTAYQVGKGMMKHVLEMAKQEAAPDDVEETEAAIDECVEEQELAFEPDRTNDPEPIIADDTPQYDEHSEEMDIATLHQTRRMRFSFSGSSETQEGMTSQG